VDDLTDGPFGVSWTWVPPRIVEVGSSKGSYQSSADGPRHEVEVDGFWVASTEIPDLSEQSLFDSEELLTSSTPPGGGLLRFPSEAEWVSIVMQTTIKPLPLAWTCDEYHTPRWGSPRDGRPWTEARCGRQGPIPDGTTIPRAAATWRREVVHRTLVFEGLNSTKVRHIPVLIPDGGKDRDPPRDPLPAHSPSHHRRIIEEFIAFLIFGGAAMCVALYNSPDYALSQPLNILLGAVFVSVASGFIWRPPRQTIRIPSSEGHESE